LSDLEKAGIKLKFLFMFKNKLNLRNVFAIVICLTAATMLSSYSKGELPNEEIQIRTLLVKLYHDTNGDGWRTRTNWLSDKPINEWYGISYSPGNLKINLVYNNLIETIDVSGCATLTYLSCSDNQLTSLNVSGCTALTKFKCYRNQLTSINVSGCMDLTGFGCDNNQLTSLDMSGCATLTYLSCSGNQLTSINVSGCEDLTGFGCDNNQLTSLDVSSCTALTDLFCNNNQLTSLDVSGYTALNRLYCYNNQLTSLDVSGCTALNRLYCHNNQLTATTLNTVFGMLPDRSSSTHGKMYTFGNPGVSTCTPSIAEAKGWTVNR